MEHTTFNNQWRINTPNDEVATNILRAVNETNRLLAEIGTLLERRVDMKEFEWEGSQ